MGDATAADVLAGRARWSAECGDCLDWLRGLPDDSVDLLFTSPPYLEARTYGIGAGRPLDEWVAWMLDVVRAAAPKVRGLIAVNCEGQTRGYRYLPAPFLLAADLHREGFNLRKPVVFHRVGIPGSGGPDWLRNDWEPVVCVTRPGKLPWSDPTACGHPPKWAPGGEMSNRMADGTRVNQWGMRVRKDGTLTATDPTKNEGLVARATKPSHKVVEVSGEPETPPLFDAGPRGPGVLTPGQRNEWGKNATSGGERMRDGRRKMAATRGYKDGDTMAGIVPIPAIANPGNVLKFNVGGGQMGHGLAHENEAPFPLELAEFFVQSFCPPDGVTCDPFGGSGTTAHAAVLHGRRAIVCDVRESQRDLTRRRLATVTPPLFTG